MTSAPTQPARGTDGRHAEGRGYGLVLFASVLLVIVGCFNLIYGIAAIDQIFFISAYPFWSLTIIAVDVVALYGLCAYGNRANLEAA